MKSECKVNVVVETGFPKLMIGTGTGVIVLMRGFCGDNTTGAGMVVNNDYNQYGIGHYSDSWCMEFMSEYDGTVNLSN